jgi:hypothetical protein
MVGSIHVSPAPFHSSNQVSPGIFNALVDPLTVFCSREQVHGTETTEYIGREQLLLGNKQLILRCEAEEILADSLVNSRLFLANAFFQDLLQVCHVAFQTDAIR